MDCPTKPAKINPKTTIISMTNTTATARGNLYLFAQLMIGLQAIAIKTDNKNGTTMALAALKPANITTIQAIISKILTER